MESNYYLYVIRELESEESPNSKIFKLSDVLVVPSACLFVLAWQYRLPPTKFGNRILLPSKFHLNTLMFFFFHFIFFGCGRIVSLPSCYLCCQRLEKYPQWEAGFSQNPTAVTGTQTRRKISRARLALEYDSDVRGYWYGLPLE